MSEKIKILFVDDSPSILQSLQRVLRPMRHQWNIAFASSGEKALALMEEAPFDVVISDMCMPGMDGSQVLTQIKDRYPGTIRIILSGHIKVKAIIRDIGAPHQFLSKPCDTSTLIQVVERTLSLRRFLSRKDLQSVITRIDAFPVLPRMYRQLTAELQSPETSIDQVAEIISRDVGMTAKIFQIANSAFFGFTNRIQSPHHAVQVLGLDMIRSLVLTYQIFKKFDPDKVESLQVDRLWTHSLNVTGRAVTIARKEKLPPNLEHWTFTSGLIHEIGKLILADNFPERYAQVLERAKTKNRSQAEAEREIFQATHAEVGAYLLGIWGMPDPMVEAVAYHLNPSRCLDKSLSPLALLHCAHVLEPGGDEASESGAGLALDESYLKEAGLLERFSHWQQGCAPLTERETHGI